MILIATRLGLIACGYLVGGYYESRYISAPEIAQRYNMNVRALMPALHRLVMAGILRSRVGGTTPGFIYAKDPKELTLFAMEGEAAFACCKELVPGLKCDCSCDEKSSCTMLSLFNGMIDNATEKLSAITVADHAERLGNGLAVADR